MLNMLAECLQSAQAHERFWLKGENEGDFSVFATSKGVGTRGVCGMQESGFANINTLLPTVSQLSFSEISTFEWIGDGKNQNIVFSSEVGNENLTAFFSATLNKE